MKYFLAIDLGASSGRHIVGHEENGDIVLDEVHRFPTGMDDSKDGLVWDIDRLWGEIKKGIKLAFSKYPNIVSLSIDTWGVDYVLLKGDKPIKPYYAYRNARNKEASEKVHAIIPFEELYRHTGIQYAAFNTLYQLFDDLGKGRLDEATDYLMLPSYFTYLLTGAKNHEYTNESTGALLKASNGEYDYEIIDKLGLPRKLFGEIKKPGYIVGVLKEDIQKEVGGNCDVVLCASHDTGSAFEAVEAPGDALILSSGTWSLLGIKSKNPIINEESLEANYTNEGGVGYIRFLKNIMGMWIPNCVKSETGYSQESINQHVASNAYKETFDVNDPSLVSPKSMTQAVKGLLKENPPQSNLELFASIYRSLALGYAKAIKEIEKITRKTYTSIYIVGGGAKNKFLNELVEAYSNKKVVALPIEATAIGNLKIQMKGKKTL